MLEGTGIATVPVVHQGPATQEQLRKMIGPSVYDATFNHPGSSETDKRMEGLYLRTEADGMVTGRAKMVRPEFVEKIKESTHWQHQVMVPNELAPGADIWS